MGIREFISKASKEPLPWWKLNDVESGENGFRITSVKIKDSPTPTVLWDEIQKITTYKRGLLTTDLICLSIETNMETYEVNEEMDGWDSFVSNCELKLKGITTSKEWWGRVMQPAFATNQETIYEKSSNKSL
nr:putative uncharacterized protein [uncultured bacterium]